jgi:hypothetical protein
MGRVTRDRHGRVDLGTSRAGLAPLGSTQGHRIGVMPAPGKPGATSSRDGGDRGRRRQPDGFCRAGLAPLGATQGHRIRVMPAPGKPGATSPRDGGDRGRRRQPDGFCRAGLAPLGFAGSSHVLVPSKLVTTEPHLRPVARASWCPRALERFASRGSCDRLVSAPEPAKAGSAGAHPSASLRAGPASASTLRRATAAREAQRAAPG